MMDAILILPEKLKDGKIVYHRERASNIKKWREYLTYKDNMGTVDERLTLITFYNPDKHNGGARASALIDMSVDDFDQLFFESTGSQMKDARE